MFSIKMEEGDTDHDKKTSNSSPTLTTDVDVRQVQNADQITQGIYIYIHIYIYIYIHIHIYIYIYYTIIAMIVVSDVKSNISIPQNSQLSSDVGK